MVFDYLILKSSDLLLRQIFQKGFPICVHIETDSWPCISFTVLPFNDKLNSRNMVSSTSFEHRKPSIKTNAFNFLASMFF